MKLISFSVYGDNPLYWRGMLANIAVARQDWPDWTVRVYSEDRPYTAEFRKAGAQVFVAAKPPGIYGMFWRFLAAADPSAEAIIFRDADSRLNPRDRNAAGAWLESGRKFHVMRDHPDHAHWPMLGGMWGVRGGVLADIRERIAKWGVWNAKLDDMRFLAEHVWPEARADMLHHSSVETPHPGAQPFPAHPEYRGFVGEIIQPE